MRLSDEESDQDCDNIFIAVEGGPRRIVYGGGVDLILQF
jgi:hypothetical protein